MHSEIIYEIMVETEKRLSIRLGIAYQIMNEVHFSSAQRVNAYLCIHNPEPSARIR